MKAVLLTPDHPAVEAAARAALADGWTCDTHEPEPWGECRDCTDSHLRSAPRALTAALPHLTADDLRNTPAGRKLMAEAWDAGYDAGERDYATALDPDHECIRNPYKEAPND